MSKKETNPGKIQMKCEDIQTVLFEYMSRELGEGRSDLIRTHLQKCPNCREEAAEIRKTMELLRTMEKQGLPACLSDDHRKRIIKAITHPILHWLTTHHILTSIIMAIIAITIVSCVLYRIKIWEDEPPAGIPITIIQELPEAARETTNKSQ